MSPQFLVCRNLSVCHLHHIHTPDTLSIRSFGCCDCVFSFIASMKSLHALIKCDRISCSLADRSQPMIAQASNRPKYHSSMKFSITSDNGGDACFYWQKIFSFADRILNFIYVSNEINVKLLLQHSIEMLLVAGRCRCCCWWLVFYLFIFILGKVNNNHEMNWRARTKVNALFEFELVEQFLVDFYWVKGFAVYFSYYVTFVVACNFWNALQANPIPIDGGRHFYPCVNVWFYLRVFAW